MIPLFLLVFCEIRLLLAPRVNQAFSQSTRSEATIESQLVYRPPAPKARGPYAKRNPARSPKTKRGFYFHFHQRAWVDSNYRPHAYQI